MTFPKMKGYISFFNFNSGTEFFTCDYLGDKQKFIDDLLNVPEDGVLQLEPEDGELILIPRKILETSIICYSVEEIEDDDKKKEKKKKLQKKILNMNDFKE